MQKRITALVDHALRTFGARRADAQALMADCFLQHGAATQPSADCYQVVVHVDVETLKDHADGRCELEHGPALSVEAVRQMACDSTLVRLDENERGNVLNVGRKTRSIPSALRRALNARDAGCRFLNQAGCPYKGAYREDAPRSEWSALSAVHDAAKIHINPDTAVTRWAGERMDFDLALHGLFDQERFRGNARRANARRANARRANAGRSNAGP